MQFDDVIRHAGAGRFERAQKLADAHATVSGKHTPGGDPDLWELPGELVDTIFAEADHEAQALDLVFTLFAALPADAVLAAVLRHYDDISEMGRTVLLAAYRRWLAGPELLARPASYSLFLELFNHPGRVDEVWPELVRPPVPEVVLERLLRISGPVPYDLKAELYATLIDEPRWHELIYHSLVYSALGEHGRIDKKAARQLLTRLTLPAGVPYRAELDAALRS